MLSSGEFRKHLRSALNHLFDPDYLRQSPLAAAFGVSGRFDTPMALQRILSEGIESLKPPPDVPEASQAWHNYDVLLYRYIQQLSQEQVASQLGVSLRQLAREQVVAWEMLALRLWEQFNLGEMDQPPVPGEMLPVRQIPTDITGELSWLEDSPRYHRVNVDEAIHTVLELVNPLAERYTIHLDVQAENDLPDVTMHPVALRQVLLSLLNIAITQAGSGRIHIGVKSLEGDVEVSINAGRSKTAADASPDTQASIQMAQKLVDLSKGQMHLSLGETPFPVRLVLPAFKPVVVLVIDDNQDILELFQRYTHGTRFQLVGTRDPRRAVGMVEKHSPRGIVLDVMMPEMDGWQMLGRLRSHPVTGHIPILICSIVSQEELAYSLGARGFLRKPVTRKNLLDALELLVESEDKGSR